MNPFLLGCLFLVGYSCFAEPSAAQTLMIMDGQAKGMVSTNDCLVDKTLVAWVSPAELTQRADPA